MRRAVVCLFAIYLLVQLALPILQLNSSSIDRLGWQMFASPAPAPVFAVLSEDGTRLAIELSDYVAFPRGDLPLAATLPAHLCQVIPGAASVETDGEVEPCP